MSTGPNKFIKLREFDYKGVPVIFVERSFFKIFLDERGFEWDVGLFLMRYMNSDLEKLAKKALHRVSVERSKRAN